MKLGSTRELNGSSYLCKVFQLTDTKKKNISPKSFTDLDEKNVQIFSLLLPAGEVRLLFAELQNKIKEATQLKNT